MQRILKNLFIFIIPLVIIIGSGIALSRYAINSGAFFAINKNAKILIIGHSQTESALNDSLIANTHNLSQGGKAYFYTYLELKKVLAENKQIKTVILSYSNNQIDAKMDKWIWGEESMTNYFPKFSFIMDLAEYQLLGGKSLPLLFRSEVIALKNNLSFILKRRQTVYTDRNWGGYLHLERNAFEANKKKKNQVTCSATLSDVNILYLDKIVTLCKQRNIPLFFLRTPVYKDYPFLKNESEFLAIKKQHFSAVPFLDFKDFPMQTNEMADFEHVDYKGAKRLSVFLDTLIKNGLLQNSNPEQMINAEISKLN